jgi:hypothetical protein
LNATPDPEQIDAARGSVCVSLSSLFKGAFILFYIINYAKDEERVSRSLSFKWSYTLSFLWVKNKLYTR